MRELSPVGAAPPGGPFRSRRRSLNHLLFRDSHRPGKFGFVPMRSDAEESLTSSGLPGNGPGAAPGWGTVAAPSLEDLGIGPAQSAALPPGRATLGLGPTPNADARSRGQDQTLDGSDHVHSQRLIRHQLLADHQGWIENHDQGSLEPALPKTAGKQEKQAKLCQESGQLRP